MVIFLYNRQKLEEKARLYEQMTKGDFPGDYNCTAEDLILIQYSILVLSSLTRE